MTICPASTQNSSLSLEPREIEKRFERLSQEEVSLMDLNSYNLYERDLMIRNSLSVAKELQGQLDDAPVLGTSIHSCISSYLVEQHFCKSDKLKLYSSATTSSKPFQVCPIS